MEEQLLNHFRQAQKSLAVQKVLLEIPLLQQQIQSHPDITHRLRSVLEIHKHTVNIEIDQTLDDAIVSRKLAPVSAFSSSSDTDPMKALLFALIFILVIVIIANSR